jgi:hypothetical protein
MGVAVYFEPPFWQDGTVFAKDAVSPSPQRSVGRVDPTRGKSPGTQLPGTQLPGNQFPGTQLPGNQFPGTQAGGAETSEPLQGVKFLKQPGPLLERPRDDATERDRAGNRRPHVGLLRGLIPLTFFNPSIKTPRGVFISSNRRPVLNAPCVTPVSRIHINIHALLASSTHTGHRGS